MSSIRSLLPPSFFPQMLQILFLWICEFDEFESSVVPRTNSLTWRNSSLQLPKHYFNVLFYLTAAVIILKNVTFSFALPLPLDLMNLKHLLIVNPQNKRSFIDLEELIRETKFSKGEIRLYINISIIVPLLTFTF